MAKNIHDLMVGPNWKSFLHRMEKKRTKRILLDKRSYEVPGIEGHIKVLVSVYLTPYGFREIVRIAGQTKTVQQRLNTPSQVLRALQKCDPNATEQKWLKIIFTEIPEKH